MQIHSTTQNSFKGYDARPLKGFIMSSNVHGIAEVMYKIGKKEGFKVFIPHQDAIIEKPKSSLQYEPKKIWAQDYWTIIKGKLLASHPDKNTELIQQAFNLNYEQNNSSQPDDNQSSNGILTNIANHFQKIFKMTHSNNSPHIAGGNIFIMKDNTVLVGEDELDNVSINDIKSRYSTKKVIVLPQMDFHLDLFIRPLDKNQILLADDQLTIDILRNGYKKFTQFMETLPPDKVHLYKRKYMLMECFIHNFEFDSNFQTLPKTNEVKTILEENGYNVINVPGRIYEVIDKSDYFLYHYCNYMNANVLINKDNELVFITNKSNVNEQMGLTKEISKRINSNFEKAFVDSISKYVKPEHIYFVDDKDKFMSETMLKKLYGGIHCVCTEVPE